MHCTVIVDVRLLKIKLWVSKEGHVDYGRNTYNEVWSYVSPDIRQKLISSAYLTLTQTSVPGDGNRLVIDEAGSIEQYVISKD